MSNYSDANHVLGHATMEELDSATQRLSMGSLVELPADMHKMVYEKD